MRPSNKGSITMERSAKRFIKAALKILSLILFTVGVAILLYSFYMILIVLKKYRKYFFSSWFLWATIATGIIFCVTACVGYAAALTRSKIFLTPYIVSISVLLVIQILIVGDVFLNDDWKKDFPKDPARRFDAFVDFVEDKRSTFNAMVFLLFLLQGGGLGLAVALRLLRERVQSILQNDASQLPAGLPFLAHQVVPVNPYVMGHPFPGETKWDVKDGIGSNPNPNPNPKDQDVWSMSSSGYPPPPYHS